jgi:hypothetical protein
MDSIEKLARDRYRVRRTYRTVHTPAVTLLALTGLILCGCASSPASGRTTQALSAADVALVRFNNCGAALANLRAAATNALAASASGAATGTAGSAAASGAAGTARGSTRAGSGPGTGAAAPSVAGAAGATDNAGQVGTAAPGTYSGTNTATPGVDEPDLVKTDGRRIVTISGGVLRVVDAETDQLTGAIDLSSGAMYAGETPANLLLAGDRALVLFSQGLYATGGGQVNPDATGSGAATPAGQATSPGPASPDATPIYGPRLVLVDLSTGTPQVISQYTIDGSLVDAREIGSVARVVIRSTPRLYPAAQGELPSADGSAGGHPSAGGSTAAIAAAGISQWLPRYSVTTGAVTSTGYVDCASVSHPAAASYTGNSMLTVLTFDLTGSSLGDGEPVTVVADGDTVYSDGTSLYIASREWPAQPVEPVQGTTGGRATGSGTADMMPISSPGDTAIYKFDISGPGLPVYEAAGSVPGWLLGSSGTAQYSMSAWNGALRVATTTSGTFTSESVQGSVSAVYVLEQSGDQLDVVGKAGGLGVGEQIYAVRFVGPAGYVVTFRQTDPLYTLDLSDPAQPRVVGQLPLTGYSAYLYPVDATHLIGLGQDTNTQGQATGTQISLFDVSDLAAPVRLATYDLQFGHSEAEFDPHAFLYWPASRLLVVPVQLASAVTPEPALPGGPAQGGPVQSSMIYSPTSEAVVLHVGDQGFTELGTITHPITPGYPVGAQIRRSLIIDSALWTLSDAGLKANDSTTLTPLAWVPFSPASQ